MSITLSDKKARIDVYVDLPVPKESAILCTFPYIMLITTALYFTTTIQEKYGLTANHNGYIFLS
jgi:hypothetical protein